MSMENLSDHEDDLDTTQDVAPNFGRDGIIFLVDCRSDMFVKDLKLYEGDKEVNHSAFALALQCCREIMIDKIRSQGKTMISVVLFGVDKGDSTRKYVLEFQPLSESSANKIKDLDSIISSETHNDFDTTYGHATDAHLADVLSSCLFNFNGCSHKLSNKRIVLFTKDDNPDGAYSDKQHQIRKRASDLKEARVDLDLIPIGRQFDRKRFYEEIIQTLKHGDFQIFQPVDENTDFYDIFDFVNQENYKKRTFARLKFHIGSQVVIGVGLHGFTSKNRYLKKINLSRETNCPVRVVRQLVNDETGAALRPYEVKKTTSIGLKEIGFSVDELSKMKKVFEPGITLLGFKPKDAWKVEFQCHSPVLMFPDETIVKGSSQFFKALLHRCIARNMVAVCVAVSRIGSRPKYALLVPQEEVVCEETAKQFLPDGFLMYYLPFARMLGNMPDIPSDFKVDSTVMQSVSDIIRKIRFRNFDINYFENPSLTKQWINIEAMALQQENPKQFVDTTLPRMEKIEGKLRDLSTKFNEAFFAQESRSLGTKRKQFLPVEGIDPPKRLRRAFIDELVTERKIDKLTVPELRELLRFVPSVSGSKLKKGELMELVYKKIDTIRKYLD